MDSTDVVDNVNALLKLNVGDPYRLEHIKQAYILNKTIWKSDGQYLEQLREKYLVKHRIDQPDTQSEVDEKLENDSEDKDMIHCWKCGKKSPTTTRSSRRYWARKSVMSLFLVPTSTADRL